MGYLDNSSITVDAVLTKLGREKLSSGNLDITKFCLGDDEIDYKLYDTSHNLGSAYYGEAIERMPVLEAFTSDPSTLKYKLVTLPKNTQVLPVITIAQSSATLDTGQQISFAPQTKNVTSGNAQGGYSFTIGNSDIVKMVINQGVSAAAVSRGISVGESPAGGYGGTASRKSFKTRPNQASQATGYQSSFTANGKAVTITGLSLTTNQTTTLTITGNETGGTVTIPITVNRDTALD